MAFLNQNFCSGIYTWGASSRNQDFWINQKKALAYRRLIDADQREILAALSSLKQYHKSGNVWTNHLHGGFKKRLRPRFFILTIILTTYLDFIHSSIKITTSILYTPVLKCERNSSRVYLFVSTPSSFTCFHLLNIVIVLHKLITRWNLPATSLDRHANHLSLFDV